MEIITGVERRRRWRREDKLRIVAELEAAGATVAEVARRHDVSRGLLWTWRRQARSGRLTAAAELEFLPVQVVTPCAHPAAEPSPLDQGLKGRRAPKAEAARIEIALADGTTVRVGPDVGAAALRRVLGVLRG